MKPEDKARLKEAFRKALERSPTADLPIEGRFDKDGTPLTMRKFVERELASEKFYQKLDEKIANGEITLDRFIMIVNRAKGPRL